MKYSSHSFPKDLIYLWCATAMISLVMTFLELLTPGNALAQDYPPFPILYGGIALADGVPLTHGTRLVARVGDYETWTTVEDNGRYRNLLVAPPDDSYYYKVITFHALGGDALEKDVFLPIGAPVFKDVGFDLDFPVNQGSVASESSSDTNRTGILFITAGLAILAMAAVAGAIVWRKHR